MDDPAIAQPSHHYFVEAVPQLVGGWLARFGIPGRSVQLVAEAPNVPAIHAHEFEAVATAAAALCQGLNAPVLVTPPSASPRWPSPRSTVPVSRNCRRSSNDSAAP